MSVSSLSGSERLGVVTMRRFHALAGTDQLRLLASALLSFFLLDLIRLTATTPGALEARPLMVVMDVLTYVALITALWRPRIGLGLAAIPLLTALIASSTSLDAVLIVFASTLGIAQLDRRGALLASGALVIYAGVRVALYTGPDRFPLLVMLGLSVGVGLALGWALRILRVRREAGESAALARATEEVRIRADERRALSRELHDVMAHQLSTSSLQMMGAQGQTDPAALHRILGTVDHATTEALTELRLLVRVLRDDPATAASGTEIRELAERVPPTQAAAAAELELLRHGFEPDVTVPAVADDLGMTIQRTLSRIITEASANVVRHAPPKCRVTVRVTVSEQQASVQMRNPMPVQAATPVWRWGLRSLNERISLTGGTFGAGVDDGYWTVSATLPLS